MTGARREWLASQFNEQRARLRSVVYRMLGSRTEADDAVRETWLRLNRAGADEIENLPGWLTTSVARVCLNLLRSRARRRVESSPAPEPDVARQREVVGAFFAASRDGDVVRSAPAGSDSAAMIVMPASRVS